MSNRTENASLIWNLAHCWAKGCRVLIVALGCLFTISLPLLLADVAVASVSLPAWVEAAIVVLGWMYVLLCTPLIAYWYWDGTQSKNRARRGDRPSANFGKAEGLK